MRFTFVALTLAAAVHAAPAILDDRVNVALSTRQEQINLTRTHSPDGGERGPASVMETVPTIVVPTTRNVQAGERPYYLVQNMTDGPLRQRLESCSDWPMRPNQFTISHRGAPLQFPEHTMQSVQAAARQGAGVIECDVAFTSDRQRVCRHSFCDLHTTTNILAKPELAAKCNQTFTPAQDGKPASAQCCTTDITLDEFKSLCGKQDGFNKSATTPEASLAGTPTWRTELYDTCGQLMTHKEYIAAVDKLGVSFTPEAKTPTVQMPFQGNYTQEQYIDGLVQDYIDANVHPSRVWLQSFLRSDVEHWVQKFPDFGRQAIYLDERTDTPEGLANATKLESMQEVASKGIAIIAPSFPWLLKVNNQTNELEESDYSINAKKAGLKIITWSLERSGPMAVASSTKDYYYTGLWHYATFDGRIYDVVHALASKVKVIGIFSDWPATVAYYSNCMGLLGGFQDPDRN